MKAMEQVLFWRAPELPGVETSRVARSRHVFPDHAHDGIYAIGLMEEGGSYCQGQGKTDALVKPGEIALINPGQTHSGVPAVKSHITYRMIYVRQELVLAAAGDMLERPSALPELRPMVVKDRRLQRKLLQISCRLQKPDDPLEIESLILDGLTHLLADYGGISSRPRPVEAHRRAVQKAREMMVADMSQKLTLAHIAGEVGLSRHYFLRVFKRATGLSPHLYRTARRIDLAKTLLRQGLSPADVALETGFVDQSHFSRKFRQLIGATPGQYIAEACKKPTHSLPSPGR